MWLICAIVTALIWGVAELFYKKGSERTTKYTHLRVGASVGIVMGIHAIYTIIAEGLEWNAVIVNMVYYFPVFFMYMFSMVLSYYGLRFIKNSIASTVQELSTPITLILCFLILGERMSTVSLIGTIFIIIGVIVLSILQKDDDDDINYKDVTKKMAIIGFIMALLYALFDGIGTFLDAFYLDIEQTPLKFVTEENIEAVANCSYELSFLIIGIAFLIYLFIKKEKVSIKQEKTRIAAAVFETIGQATYVYAMSGNAMIAAPIISAMVVVTLVLSRIFLKEKLNLKQYGAIIAVVIGVFILGIEEVSG